jgi:XTP/dITP diphosphohydrolase
MAALLTPYGIELANLDDYPQAPEVEETGTTFAENAALKASQVAQALKMWTIADDSGLEVDALGGRPGVYSARYAGTDGDDAANNTKLLQELQGVPDERRGAAFACHLALSDPAGEIRLRVEDRCRGRIVHELHGENGFGYDPLFLVLEYHRTFGELGPALKNVLSHRARAFMKLAPQIAAVLHP